MLISIAPRRRSVVLAALAVLIAAGCSSAPASTPSPTPLPKATSALEFGTAACSALTAMSRAIGNPDTASDSVLSAALDDAIRAGDLDAVETASARMRAELAKGRQLAAVAAGWTPGAAAATNIDRLIAAFEAMTEAKRAAAGQGINAADQAGQAALIDAGGGEAWQQLLYGGLMPADARQGFGECRFWEAGLPTAAPVVTPAPASALPEG